MAFVATFYSYKGGVGRTAALVNVAWAMASAGQRVLIVDTDLEAPGFDEYEELSGPEHPGFLELAEEYARVGRCPEVTGHLHRAPNLPNLWVLPAGVVDPRWAQRVNALDWTALHPTLGTRPFLDELRKRFDEAIRPDYILVDARTGFAEVAGVTTHQLADLVVLLFRQTRTSIRGTIQAFRSLGAQQAPVPVLPVVSLVPPGQAASGTLGGQRIARVRELLGPGAPDLVRVDYDAAAMVAEGIPMRTPELYPQATAGYRVLVERLCATNPADLGRARARALAIRAEGRDGIAHLEEHVRNFPSAPGWAALGAMLLEAGRHTDAARAFDTALSGQDPAARWRIQRAEARLATGDVDGADEDLAAARGTVEDAVKIAVLEARVAERRGDREGARAARRALRAALGYLVYEGERPRRPLVERVLGALPPREGFDASVFWDRLSGSAVIPVEAQRRLLEDLMDGDASVEELTLVERVLEAERRATRGLYDEARVDRIERERRAGATSETPVTEWEREAWAGRLVEAATRATGALEVIPHTPTRYLPTRESVAALRHEALTQAIRAAGAQEDGLPSRNGQLTIAWGTLGAIQGAAGREALEHASEAARRLVEAMPADPGAWHNLAVTGVRLAALAPTSDRQRLLEEAARAAVFAVDLDPANTQAVQLAASCLFRHADAAEEAGATAAFRRVVELLEAAARRQPRSEVPLAWIAEAYARLDDAERAKSALADAYSVHLDDPNRLANRAKAAVETIRRARAEPAGYDAAIDDLRRALTARPLVADDQEALANAILHRLPSLDRSAWAPLVAEARAACETANRLSPGKGDYNLACLHARLGELDRAEPLLERYVAATPDPDRVARHALADPDLAELLSARPALAGRLRIAAG